MDEVLRLALVREMPKSVKKEKVADSEKINEPSITH
jgi:hypothetical protein